MFAERLSDHLVFSFSFGESGMPLCSTEIKGWEHLYAQQHCKSGCGWIKPVLLVLEHNRRWQGWLFDLQGEPDASRLSFGGSWPTG